VTDLLDLFVVFLRAGAFSVGGMAALPQLRQDLVAPGILTEHQVLEALAIGRITPGPTGFYVMVLGYFAAGPVGAVIAILAAAIPPLSVVAVAGLVRRQLLSGWAAGVVRGVVLAAAGLLVYTGLTLIAPDRQLLDVPAWQLVITALAVALTIRGRIHPGLLVAAGALAGIALGR
jgi:chromate transporter